MSVATFKIGKKEFVIVPRRRYEELTRAEQDLRDATIAKKGLADWTAGKVKAIPLSEARRKWGV